MKYHWIGHCREGNSDKVWGLIRLTGTDDPQYGYRTNNYVAFWGRRGKKLQTKIHHDISAWDADKLCEKKEDRGYSPINPNRLDEVYPEFEEDLQKTTVWAVLSV
jgi:predicted DNA-binding WGR domain protein